jgi:hypothetical protein
VNLAAQGTDAFAMDDAHFENPALAACSQVLGHEFLHLAWQERVQVQDSVDGDFCCRPAHCRRSLPQRPSLRAADAKTDCA